MYCLWAGEMGLVNYLELFKGIDGRVFLFKLWLISVRRWMHNDEFAYIDKSAYTSYL